MKPQEFRASAGDTPALLRETVQQQLDQALAKRPL